MTSARETRSATGRLSPALTPAAGGVRDWLEHLAAVVVLGTLLVVLEVRGGWAPHAVPAATTIAGACALLLRFWQRLPGSFILVVSLPALAAVAVAAGTTFGDAGPVSLARWGCFAAVATAIAAYASTPQRRMLVLALLLLIGLRQFSVAWLSWWGGGTQAPPSMWGSIYLANPFGGLMLAFAMLAGALAGTSTGSIRWLGMVTAPVAGAAVVLSGARAAILLMLTGCSLIALLATRLRGWRGLRDVTVVALVCYAVLQLLTSSIFFDQPGSATAAVAAKHSGAQTLDYTTSIRFDYWRAAFSMIQEDPVLGAGAGSFFAGSRAHMPASAERTPFVHNEPLNAIVEGGLLLGGAVIALYSYVFFVALLAVHRCLRSPHGSEAAVPVAAAAAAVALLLHALVDFPLSLPAVLALLGVLIALMRPPAVPVPVGVLFPRPRRHAAASLMVLSVVGAVYVGVSHDRHGTSRTVAPSSAVESGLQTLPGLRDNRVVVARARALLARDKPADVAVQRALLELGRASDYDVDAIILRAALLEKQGAVDEAMSLLATTVRKNRTVSPLLLIDHAQALVRHGRTSEATDLLLLEVVTRAGESPRVDRDLVRLLRAAEALNPGRLARDCAVAALGRTVTFRGAAPRPIATASPARSACERWVKQVADLRGREREAAG